jgi:hypothetical protein
VCWFPPGFSVFTERRPGLRLAVFDWRLNSELLLISWLPAVLLCGRFGTLWAHAVLAKVVALGECILYIGPVGKEAVISVTLRPKSSAALRNTPIPGVITDSFPGKGDKFSVRILSLKAEAPLRVRALNRHSVFELLKVVSTSIPKPLFVRH